MSPKISKNGSRDPNHANSRVGFIPRLRLYIAYLCTEFVKSSFGRSKGVVGAREN